MQSQSSLPEASVALCARPRQYGGSLAVLASAPEHASLIADLARVVNENAELSCVRHRNRDDRFDLSYHLRWETIDSDSALFPIAAQRLCEPLDLERPLWELHVLQGPTRTQVLLKLDPELQEHIGAHPFLPRLVSTQRTSRKATTGASASTPFRETLEVMRSSAVALSESAEKLAAAARDALGTPSELASSALRTARFLGTALTERLTDPPPGPFSDLRSDRRSFALIDLPLAALEVARTSLGVGLDALLLSITSGALARLEHEHHGSIPHALRALVALPRQPRTGIVLPLDESDPLERSALIGEILTALARTPPLPTLDGIAGLVTALPRALARLSPGGTSDCSVSVRYDGDSLDGCTLAGAEVLRVYPFNGTLGSTSLSIGAQPFGRWLGLGLSFDPNAAASPRRLAEAIQDSAAELLSAVGAGQPRS